MSKRVYGVTIRDESLICKIANFARLEDFSETEAVRLAVELFFIANNKEKAALKKRLEWKQHRNRGFRRLTSFASRTSAHVLPDLPASNPTSKATH